MAISSDIPLNAGEKVLWTGAPPPNPFFFSRYGTAKRYIIPGFGSIAFGCFRALQSSGANRIPPLVVGPIVLGVWLLGIPLMLDAWSRARTAYVVTNERVVIISGRLRRTVTSLNLRTLTDVTLTSRNTSQGTVAFVGPRSWSRRMGWFEVPPVPVFEKISSARAVYDLIQQAQGAALAPSSVAAQA